MELIGAVIRVWIIMLDPRLFAVFLGGAFLLAIIPGPGIFYVLTRTLTGGTREGVLSSLGTFLGGLVHVLAAALGLSALLATSATAFLAVKYVGAIYLMWIGFRMILTRNENPDDVRAASPSTPALRQGILTELLNPKTALFFLHFYPCL
jgi:threonine/homoserine/homoserine lactone efflux protein